MVVAKHLVVVLLLVAVLPASEVRAQTPVPTGTLTLADALRIARERQPAIMQAMANVDAAHARWGQARSYYLPQLNGSVFYQRTTANFVARPSYTPNLGFTIPPPSFTTFNFYSLAVTASQLVYDFGQTNGRMRAASATARSVEWDAVSTELDVELNVRTVYFAARANKELVHVADQTLANQERHLAQVEGFVEVGTRPAIDVARARTDVANARVQQIQAENNYALAKAQLDQAMGVETETSYEVGDELSTEVAGEGGPLEMLVQEALESRPEYRSLLERSRAQSETIRALQGSYGPSLGVSTQFTDAGKTLGNLGWNWNATITLTWAIFQGGLTRNQVSEARALLSSIEAQAATLRLQVRLEVRRAMLSVHAALAAREAADVVVVNASELLRLAEGRYTTGVGNAVERGDAQVSLTSAEAQRVQAGYDLATARANLIRALGRRDASGSPSADRDD